MYKHRNTSHISRRARKYLLRRNRDTECKKNPTAHRIFWILPAYRTPLAFIYHRVFYFIYFLYFAQAALQIAIRMGSEIEKGEKKVDGNGDWSCLDDC